MIAPVNVYTEWSNNLPQTSHTMQFTEVGGCQVKVWGCI